MSLQRVEVFLKMTAKREEERKGTRQPQSSLFKTRSNVPASGVGGRSRLLLGSQDKMAAVSTILYN